MFQRAGERHSASTREERTNDGIYLSCRIRLRVSCTVLALVQSNERRKRRERVNTDPASCSNFNSRDKPRRTRPMWLAPGFPVSIYVRVGITDVNLHFQLTDFHSTKFAVQVLGETNRRQRASTRVETTCRQWRRRTLRIREGSRGASPFR